MIHNIPQPAFEDLIAKRLSKTGFVEVRKNHSFVSLEQESCMHADIVFIFCITNLYQNSDEVITTVEDRVTRKEYRIKSRHVIACDGAKSAVRKHLGITSEGEEASKLTMFLLYLFECEEKYTKCT